MRSSVECSQRLQHAQETVGGWELQVFLWDIAYLTSFIASLKNTYKTETYFVNAKVTY